MAYNTDEEFPIVIENIGEKVANEALNIQKKKSEIIRSRPSSPILRVASDTPPKRLCKTIIGCLKDWGTCRILAVGERPSWQAYKATVLAKKELAGIGLHIYIDPSFMDPRPVIDNTERTGADFVIVMTKSSF